MLLQKDVRNRFAIKGFEIAYFLLPNSPRMRMYLRHKSVAYENKPIQADILERNPYSFKRQ